MSRNPRAVGDSVRGAHTTESMPDTVPILDSLDQLARRERRVSWWRAVLWSAAAGLVAWTGAVGLAWSGVARHSVRWSVGVPLALVAAALVGWAVAAWTRSRDRARQARAVEGQDPDLQGLVLSAMEGGGPGGSESVFALVTQNAQAGLDQVDPSRLYPARVLRVLAALLLCAVGWAVVGVLAPMGPFATLSWLSGEAQALVDVPLATETPAESEVLIGDITLRYDYPAYTGLLPVEVPNSNGEAHGPPGTRVTVSARTLQAYDGALVQSYDQVPLRGTVDEGGRLVQGSFDISEDGTWRVVLQRGAATDYSPEFAIQAEPDTAPVVDLEAPSKRLELAPDDPIPVSWSARDDYGLSKVGVNIGKRTATVLDKPLDGPLELRGDLKATPAQLGLKPGDEVNLTIVAWDTDQIAQPKMGRSRSVRIIVLGEDAEISKQIAFRRELRDALVDSLAPFVTDDAFADSNQGYVSSWALNAGGRFAPLNAVIDANWDGFDPRSLEGRIIEEVKRDGGGLLRFAQEVGVPGSVDPMADQDLETLQELHGDLVAVMETYVLMLDRVVRYQAMGQLIQQADALASAAEAVPPGLPAADLTVELDALDAAVLELLTSAQDWDSGRLSNLVERYSEDLGHLSDAARDAADADDLDRATELMGWYAEESRRLATSLRDMQAELKQMTEGEEEKLKKLIEELERIEAAERALQEQTADARERLGAGDSELVEGWEAIERDAQAAHDRAQAALAAVEASADGRTPGELVEVRSAAAYAERLLEAVQARDLYGARNEATSAQLELGNAAGLLEWQDKNRSMRGRGPQSAGAIDDLAEARSLTRDVDRSLRALNELANASTPALSKAVRGMTEEQTGLLEDTRATQQPAAEIAAQLPMGAPGLEENLDAAVREMERAERALGKGRAMEAEGAEEAAADRIRQALESLQSAASAQGDMSSAMGEGGEGQDEGQDTDGQLGEEGAGGDEFSELQDPHLDLPEPEDDVDVARYREQLLQGMEGEVPEEYEALKRRYYEELVRQ